MAVLVTPLSAALGARITGVDLSGGLDDATMNDIRQVWLDHFVIVIPGQDLTGADQLAFTEWFGPLKLPSGWLEVFACLLVLHLLR